MLSFVRAHSASAANRAAHRAAALRTLLQAFSNEGKPMVVQFSVKNEKKETSFCGGGYIKIHPSGQDKRAPPRLGTRLHMLHARTCTRTYAHVHDGLSWSSFSSCWHHLDLPHTHTHTPPPLSLSPSFPPSLPPSRPLSLSLTHTHTHAQLNTRLALHTKGLDQEKYGGEDKYNVMFGPDLCGYVH